MSVYTLIFKAWYSESVGMFVASINGQEVETDRIEFIKQLIIELQGIGVGGIYRWNEINYVVGKLICGFAIEAHLMTLELYDTKIGIR